MVKFITALVKSEFVCRKGKAPKVATARTLWVPAINNHGGFGRWAFLEIDYPWNENQILTNIGKAWGGMRVF